MLSALAGLAFLPDSSVPTIPDQFYTFVNGSSSGNVSGVSPVSGYGMSNSTFSDFTTTIDPTVFDHPDSRVTFGKCKECGVDDECPMWQCMQ